MCMNKLVIYAKTAFKQEFFNFKRSTNIYLEKERINMRWSRYEKSYFSMILDDKKKIMQTRGKIKSHL